ncbi:MAG TPA: DUF2953 domain-containing protein [Vicinamibacterales bacterium]|nr:DUF2953 domain-containing protein [Vicinamibacterales bacterium]
MAVLVVLTALVLGVVGLLFVPLRAKVEFDSEAEAAPLRWRVRWVALSVGNDRPSRRRRARKPRPDRPSRPRRGGAGSGPRLRAALGTPGLPGRVGRLAGDLLAAVGPTDLDAAVRIGLDDPASTGMLFGRLAAVAAVCPQRWRVHIEPDFEEATLQACGSLRWSVSPARVLWPVATFLAAPAVWRAARAAWRVRSKRSL